MKAGGRHVSPAWIIRIDRSRVNPHAAPRCAPARVLALWSYGIALTRSCGRLTVATFLALLMGQKVATVEQRLYEWCCDPSRKAGAKRQPLDVTACFVPLLRWIVTLWTRTHLALALDATTLGARFVVLTLSVVYRGCGIPVAWTVLPANQPGAWRREWCACCGACVLPSHRMDSAGAGGPRFVGALALGRIVRLGWHPLLRINNGAKSVLLADAVVLAPRVGPRREPVLVWPGDHLCLAARRLNCTLVAWWGEGYTDPWFLLTDLAPEASDAAWYGLRSWCEQGFKCFKRGGWQWQYTQMHARAGSTPLVGLGRRDPVDGQRGWCAGGRAIPRRPQCARSASAAGDNGDDPGRQRRLRLMRLGWLWCLVCQITTGGLQLPQRLVPEPWPAIPLGTVVVAIHQNSLKHQDV